MSLITYSFLTLALVIAEVLFLRMARYFAWFDKPNERSLHTNPAIIRGGGIVFYLAILGASFFSKMGHLWFLSALTLVALVSFWDDLYTVPKRYRIASQIIAVAGLLSQMNSFYSQWWLFAGALIAGVGLVNAFNFMDGINGMTAFYGLITTGTIWYWQTQILQTEPDPLLGITIVALLVFGYFNARRQAICFAGDVGSISIGFISLYFLLNAIRQSQTCLPLLFVAVYGIDTVLTIGQRLYQRQNIFQAHRQHLFQVLVHERQWPHLRVSALYALVQLGINGLTLSVMVKSPMSQYVVASLIIFALMVMYLVMKSEFLTTKKGQFLKPTPYN